MPEYAMTLYIPSVFCTKTHDDDYNNNNFIDIAPLKTQNSWQQN